MPEAPLSLEVMDFQDAYHWRWVLKSATGAFLADHPVALDRADPRYQALIDLPGYLRLFAAPDRRDEDERRLIQEVGTWIAEKVLGSDIVDKLRREAPPSVVCVTIPAGAEQLLLLPLEVARSGDRPLSRRGVSFVFDIQGREARVADPISGRLRMLAVFSLPPAASPLNLRRERRALQALVEALSGGAGLAIELRVLQFGVTRQALEEMLEEGEGWDIIHFSGHGEPGTLLLERPDGSYDEITSEQLAELLMLAGRRLKLVTLSACLSAAASIEQTLGWLGIETGETRRDTGDTGKDKVAPAVARELVDQLGCAVLAMRYAVEDEFATALARELYENLFQRRQPLPRATQRALDHVLGHDAGGKALAFAGVTSAAAPALFGATAVGLMLVPPEGAAFQFAASGLAYFDKAPDSFVGRVAAMTQASVALAVDSGKAGALFLGMAGAGKTSCAVELAWHHATAGRFRDFVWFRAPEMGREIALALRDLALALERSIPDLGMLTVLDDAAQFRDFLPRLAAFLERNAILLVLDNLESLLTDAGVWRDDRWGLLLQALTARRGLSRVVLTSRVKPAELAAAVAVIPIHALPRNEALLAARERPHLRQLMDGSAPGISPAEGRLAVRRVLRLVQGHPKLIELADGLAAEPAKLLAQLDRAEAATGTADLGALEAFFDAGETRTQLDPAAFMAALRGWTEGIAGTLSEEARLFFHFLCALEEDDRNSFIIANNWSDVWKRLERAEPAPDATALLRALTEVGLVEQRSLNPDDPDQYVIGIHPGVAEAGRTAAGATLQQAVDRKLAAAWETFAAMGHRGEAERDGSAGQMIVRAGIHAFPYLSRLGAWDAAVPMLEGSLGRDGSPQTVGAVLPLLRQVVRATEGTQRALVDRGVLANALMDGGFLAEAEQEMRAVLADAEQGRDFNTASSAAGVLINLLRDRAHYQEVLELAERKLDLTRRAGRGPWSQIADEGQRLQILSRQGDHAEVLQEVNELRVRMEGLPDPPDENDRSINVWNVRETTLDIGRSAALGLEEWQQALDLNEAIRSSKERRGAPTFELARTRFNDYGPLLDLDRFGEAEALLRYCRSVFEEQGAGALYELGSVMSAWANLESERGRYPPACQFEETALRYRYLVTDVRGALNSHFNLANYLTRAAADARLVVAHRLAALLPNMLMSQNDAVRDMSALLGDLERAAESAQAALPVDFASLCATVEQVEGVRFRALIEALARGETDGDTLLKVAVELVHQAQAQEEAEPPAASMSPAEEPEEATIPSSRPLVDDEDELPLVPSLRGPTAEAAAVLEDARTRRILFATNRAPDPNVLFSGERRDTLSFGSLLVRIPEEHDLGNIERPRSFGLFGWTLWRQQEDPERHFVLKAVRHLDADGFVALARENPTRAALVFVHGFNVSFTDGAFRLAQIVFDIQYEGIPVLFSWPARGGVLNYFYDRESAGVSRGRFTELLHLLQDQAEIQEIHVIAHSMGNQVVLEALAHAIGGPLSRPIGELITAAPDVDRDHYRGIAAKVRAVSRGMTLYASSADKALITSRELAGIPRAGDVGPDGPVVVDGIEAIDVTAIGTDMFSLNHSEFAHNRSLIDDIGRLLISGSRPPHRRSTQIRPVPEGSQQPVYWYYPS